MIAALADPRSWRTEAPAAADRIVVVRRDDRPDQILVHPMGTLQVQQGVAPLNLSLATSTASERPARAAPAVSPSRRSARRRQPDAAAGARAVRARPATSTSPTTSGSPPRRSRTWTPAWRSATTPTAFAASAVVRSPFDYTDITIGADGKPTVEPEPVPAEAPVRDGARRTRAPRPAPSFAEPTTRFAAATAPEAPVMRPLGYSRRHRGRPRWAGHDAAAPRRR